MTEGRSNRLRTARIYQATFLASIFVYAAILVYLRRYRHVIPVDGPLVDRYQLIFIVLGIINLAYGYLAPRIVTKHYNLSSWQGQEQRLELAINVTRAGSFEALAVYGFVLGLFGASWEVVLAFFAVAFIAMVHTFPRNTKL